MLPGPAQSAKPLPVNGLSVREDYRADGYSTEIGREGRLGSEEDSGDGRSGLDRVRYEARPIHRGMLTISLADKRRWRDIGTFETGGGGAVILRYALLVLHCCLPRSANEPVHPSGERALRVAGSERLLARRRRK